MEEILTYNKFLPYSKFEFSHQRTESEAFVTKTTEFLTAKHWLTYSQRLKK